MKVYPSWRYHRTLEPRLVHDEDSDKSLGKEWADTPAAFDTPAAELSVQNESSEIESDGVVNLPQKTKRRRAGA